MSVCAWRCWCTVIYIRHKGLAYPDLFSLEMVSFARVTPSRHRPTMPAYKYIRVPLCVLVCSWCQCIATGEWHICTKVLYKCVDTHVNVSVYVCICLCVCWCVSALVLICKSFHFCIVIYCSHIQMYLGVNYCRSCLYVYQHSPRFQFSYYPTRSPFLFFISFVFSGATVTVSNYF